MEEESPEEEIEYEDNDDCLGVAAGMAMMPNFDLLLDEKEEMKELRGPE